MTLPRRKWLYHTPPNFLPDRDEVYFITLCCQDKDTSMLIESSISQGIIDSVKFGHERGDWHFHIVLIMPNHIHAILSLPRNAKALAENIRDWKRLLSRRFGIAWQKGFFDHRLRDERSFSEKFTYIENNPIRAGFCQTPKDWPHQWRPNH